MSGIATGVRVNDGLSPAFAAMTQSINICLGSFAQMQAATGQAVNTTAIHQEQVAMNDLNVAAAGIDGEMAKAAAGIDEVSKSAAGIDGEMAKAAAGQDRYNKTVAAGENHAGNLMHKVMGLVGAYASINAVKGIVSISDEMTQTTARLNLMNDGLQSTQELTNMVFAAANDARGSYTDMAAVAARFGNNAKDAFSSSAEVVDFASLIQKQMTIAGASTNEAANAMFQLSQGLGSGVLRGEELNSVFEQAPNIIQNIADYLNVPIGEIRNMASEGNLTADVVKQAMFAATDDINEKFASMPMTWGQIGTQMQNTAIQVFQPVLNQINQIANSENAQNVFGTLINGMAGVAAGASIVFGAMVDGANWVIENWDTISPVVYGVAAAVGAYAIAQGLSAAATVISAAAAGAHIIALGLLGIAQIVYGIAASDAAIAQVGLNAAMAAFPGFWIVAIIIGIVVAIGVFISHMNGAGTTAMDVFGAICGGVNVVLQFFKNLGMGIANIGLGIGAAMGACATNIGIAFKNSLLGVQQRFYTLTANVLTCIANIAAQLSKLPFIQFDNSGIQAAADSYKAKAEAAEAAKGTYVDVGAAYDNAQKYKPFQAGWVDDAYSAGQDWAQGIADKFKTKEKEENGSGGGSPAVPPPTGGAADNTAAIAGNTADIANNTAAIANSVDISNQQLKYLRDIAEREAVNRFTTAKIKVEMTNHNRIDSSLDLDGIVNNLTTSVSNAMSKAAEGVHA